MTEEEQGAAEWLREKAQSIRRANGFGCKELMASEFGKSCVGRRCADCYADLLERIADRIDAERALPEGVEWPRFEDGEPVKVGDEVGNDEPFTAKEIAFESDRWLIKASSRSAFGCFHGAFGEAVKRPAPEVLDADGVPIKVGDTVWAAYGERRKHVVKAVCSDGSLHQNLRSEGCCMVDYEEGGWDFADRVSHEPDSWRLWGEDLATAVKVGEVDKVEMMRRAKALAKVGEVE